MHPAAGLAGHRRRPTGAAGTGPGVAARARQHQPGVAGMMAAHYLDLGFAGMTDVLFQNLTPNGGVEVPYGTASYRTWNGSMQRNDPEKREVLEVSAASKTGQGEIREMSNSDAEAISP
jgi:hypothetical protein